MQEIGMSEKTILKFIKENMSSMIGFWERYQMNKYNSLGKGFHAT